MEIVSACTIKKYPHYRLSIFLLVAERRCTVIMISQSWGRGGGDIHGVKKLGDVFCWSVRFLFIQTAQVPAISLENNMEGTNGSNPLFSDKNVTSCYCHGFGCHISFALLFSSLSPPLPPLCTLNDRHKNTEHTHGMYNLNLMDSTYESLKMMSPQLWLDDEPCHPQHHHPKRYRRLTQCHRPKRCLWSMCQVMPLAQALSPSATPHSTQALPSLLP